MGTTYFQTPAGILKIIEIVFNFIGMVCVAAFEGYSSYGDAFLVASIGGLIITIILFVIFSLDLNEKITLPWNYVEMGYCVIWAVFYIITSGLVISIRNDGYIAGGVFGLFASIVYLIDAYDKFKQTV